MWSAHTRDYYSAFERKEILTHSTARMNQEDIILSEISQSQKDDYYIYASTYKRSLSLSLYIYTMSKISLSLYI